MSSHLLRFLSTLLSHGLIWRSSAQCFWHFLPGRKHREAFRSGLLAGYPSHTVSLSPELYPRARRAQQAGVHPLRDQDKTVSQCPGCTPGWDPSSGEHQAPEQSRRCCSLITTRDHGHGVTTTLSLAECSSEHWGWGNSTLGLSNSVMTGSGGQTPSEGVRVRERLCEIR